MLLVTPYFLNRLGSEKYGQWVLINSLIASLGILNLGLGDATIRYISKYRFSDPSRTVKIANTTYSFYLAISIIGFIMLFVFLVIEQSFALFIPQDKNNFIQLLKLGLILFCIRLIEQIIFSIYKGFERFDLFCKNSVSSKAILILTSIFIVFLGYDLDTILLFSVISSFLFLIVEFVLLSRYLPGFSILPKFHKSVFVEIIGFGLWSWIQSIIGILGYQLDKFLVAGLAGVTVLAYYSIGFTIASQLFNLFVAGSNWIFPKVSRSEVVQKEMTTLYHKSQFMLMVVASISITTFYLIKDPILSLWLGEDSYSKAVPFINAYCIYILFTAVTIVPSFFTLGTSSMKIMTSNAIFSLAVSGAAMYSMFQFFGPIGLVFGRTIAGFITVPVFIFLLYKFILKIDPRYLFIELLLPISFAALMFNGTNAAWIAAGLTLIGVCFHYLKNYFWIKRLPV
jgi:O-antigen/teichoic acid export membrane protein